eukprot:TRINITY_DN114641_c0_g1_i1.p1 TRINITY_DN114641_c0_g1~~TRINITY_DN114641_c0_g1_i1.p1  ORF type:complete len:382 (-),score=49.30 TRINITY_DN114641_c0_g1_i1:59-1054(-)
MLEKEWGECWADRISTADYIAVVDSDVVFTSFVLPQLIFEPGPDRPRPVIMGHATHAIFPATVAALKMKWEAEFMDNFPLMIHRSHFEKLRKWIVRAHRVKDPSPLDPFDAAFLRYLAAVLEESARMWKEPECICFHSMMGSFLWYTERSSYVWSIRHGHVTEVPVQHTCPHLRVAHHVSYWGMDNWMARYGYKYRQMKFDTLPTQVSDLAYRARAASLMAAGICAVRWVEPLEGSPGHLSTPDGVRRPMLRSVNSSWRHIDDGLQDVHRDLCTHGLGLVSSRASVEDRLVSHTFPAERWTPQEAAHCGPRTPERLLVAYRRLMAAHVFVP